MFDRSSFLTFAAHLTIPSRDEGMVPMRRLYGTQRYALDEIERGLADGVRSFLILKGGRQIGGSTLLDALTLHWLQTHDGMVGQMVSDDLPNMKYRRKLLRQMLASLPRQYRYPTNADNLDFLEWAPPNGSTLVFDYAGIRSDSNLGRSKGLNFLYADEVGSWPDQKAVSALEAALSETYVHRLYAWVSTARGFNTFAEMWSEAEHAVSTRRIFVAWYRHEGYRVEADDPRFPVYSRERPTSDERLWIREVKRRYELVIQPEQLVWYRWKLAEGFLGDETMMAQEFGNLPEECFQAFGDKFIPQGVVRRLHADLRHAPKPTGYQYEAGQHFDETTATPCAPTKAPLLVWQEPEPGSAYIIAGHPWGSSDPSATHWVAQVWRAWPDALVQCAEYSSETGTTYAFAWLLLYLAGAYNLDAQPFIVVEAGGPGYAVMKEIQLMREKGYGLSSSARAAGLQDVLGCFRHYFWARPDNLGWRTAPLDIKTNPDILPYLLHALADGVIRGHLTIWSPKLIQSLAALRRGATGDNDQIGGRDQAHAMCAALAVRCWADFAMADLVTHVAPKETPRGAARHMGEVLVSDFLERLQRTGRGR